MQKVEKTIAGKEMRLETGRIARQSNGAVLVSLGETTVLATVNAAKEPGRYRLFPIASRI